MSNTKFLPVGFLALTDGRKITIEEADMPGMAGEPTTVCRFRVTGTEEVIPFKVLRPLMTEDDQQTIGMYVNSIDDSNRYSAISWVK